MPTIFGGGLYTFGAKPYQSHLIRCVNQKYTIFGQKYNIFVRIGTSGNAAIGSHTSLVRRRWICARLCLDMLLLKVTILISYMKHFFKRFKWFKENIKKLTCGCQFIIKYFDPSLPKSNSYSILFILLVKYLKMV